MQSEQSPQFQEELKPTKPTSNEPTPQQPTPQPGLTSNGGKSGMNSLEETLARMQVSLKAKLQREAEGKANQPLVVPLIAPKKESSNALPINRPKTLGEDPMTQMRVLKILQFCWMTLSLYGKKTDDFDTMAEGFMLILSDYPASDVEQAFKTYLEQRSEFPSPANIIGLVTDRIKRDSIYYAKLVKKGGERDYNEDIYVKKYEQQTLNDFE